MVQKGSFRTRVAQLLQRSRKAMRLYSSVSKVGGAGEFAELQASEWRRVNELLVAKLTTLLSSSGGGSLQQELRVLFEQMRQSGSSNSEEIETKRRAVLFAARNGDYVRVTTLGRQLVALQAGGSALAAVCHELESVMGNKLGASSNPVREEGPDSSDGDSELSSPRPGRKVVQFRR